MKNNKYSISDIARLSGVSAPTVSRVLNNVGNYTEETEAKVRRVIQETGYQPNLFAKGLRTNNSHSVGIIVPDITNEFFASITLAIQKKLFEQSYTTVICNTDEQPSVQARQLKALQSSRVSGIIFISGEDISEEDLDDGIPKVFVDRIPWNAEARKAVTVEADNYLGGQLAAGALLDSGCRSIAALFDSRGLRTQVARYAGFTRAFSDRGLYFDPALYRSVEHISYECGYKAVMDMCKNGVEFDGVFCYADALAFGAVRALNEMGVNVPEQVAVTGFDDVSAAKWAFPALTTVAQPVREMGEKAAELIMMMDGGKIPEEKQYVLPVRLEKRETTKSSR
jgi:LacI family transcriptional regulator